MADTDIDEFLDDFPVPAAVDAAATDIAADVEKKPPRAGQFGAPGRDPVEAGRSSRPGSRSKKKSKTKTPAKTPPSKGPADAKEATPEQLAEVSSALRSWCADLGTAGLMVAPVPAAYILNTPEEVIESATRLAGTNPKIVEFITGGSNVVAALVVLRWLAGLGVAGAVQFEKLPADHILARKTGVTDVVDGLIEEGWIVAEEPNPVVASVDADARPSGGTAGPARPAASSVVASLPT